MTRLSHWGALVAAVALAGCGWRAEAASAKPGYTAAGLYNSANSYARAGKPGMAVLYYERAQLLAPNDPDIEANLRRVRESSRLPPESPDWLARLAALSGPTEISWIGLIGFAMAGIAMVAGRRYARYRWTRRMALLLGIALVSLTAANGMLVWPRMHEAVIVAGPAPVRVSPVPMGDALLTLPEAVTVKATVEHEGFVLIQTASGQTGWVSRANLIRVVPQE